MSIEKNFDRIATALERIASVLEKKPATAEVVSAPPIPAVPASVAKVPDVPAPVTPPPVTPPPVTQTTEPTAKEVNDVLVAEVARLGGADKIFALMQEQFGSRSVTSIEPSNYNALIAAVKAIA